MSPPPALQWSHRHSKLSGIIVTEEEAPPTMFAYPTSPSSGQICVRLTDTQPVTWCDREMECWRQCLRRSPPSDHQGPGTTRGHQGKPPAQNTWRFLDFPSLSTFARVPEGKHVVQTLQLHENLPHSCVCFGSKLLLEEHLVSAQGEESHFEVSRLLVSEGQMGSVVEGR